MILSLPYRASSSQCNLLYSHLGVGVHNFQDSKRLMEILTYPAVEEAVKKRVEMKAKAFGQEVTMEGEIDGTDPVYKIRPTLVADLYGEWIMPLTKEVQVQYLLRRLD